MKNSYVTLLIFLTLGLLSGACKKELNVYPTTSTVDGNLITDQKSAQVVLNGVYYRFADARAGIFTSTTTFWTDIHEILPSRLTGSLYHAYRSYVDTFNMGLAYPLDSYLGDALWQYDYALVNAANGFISNATPATALPAAVKQRMLSEARFLKAFGHSELLLYFGQYNDPSSKYGIILRDTFVTSDNVYLPRTGVAAAYTSILADLDAAIQGLPAVNTAMYYANASAAKLLKARVLMNRGAPGDYTQVIGLTKDIIANGPFSLEDSVKDVFLTKGFNSKEVMLGVQPYPDEEYKFLNNQLYHQFVLRDSFASLFADDARRQWVFKHVLMPGGFMNILWKYYAGDTINVVKTPLSLYCYAFRLSEAYLLQAEAITLSNGDPASAKSLLTTVLAHAGAGPGELAAVANAATPAAVQLEIVKENMRNFAFENGLDWLALRRLPFATIQSINPTITDPAKLILPIPLSELTYNNVIQNPGY